MLALLLFVLAVLVGVFYLLSGDTGPFANIGGGEIAYLILGGSLIAVWVLSLSGDYRGRAGRAVRHIATWLGILLALIVGYSYRAELSQVFDRVAGEVLPPGQSMTVVTGDASERTVRLRRVPGGHFVAKGTVNGAAMGLLVDTGATTVVLRPADAERAGINTSGLNFTVPVSTANGTTYAAPVRLKSVAIGPIDLRDVEALVAKPGSLKQSLLGMSFLRRLRSYEFSGEFLTLRG